MRSPYGRVRDRLLVHAFSLPKTDFGGSNTRETLREVAEQMQAYVEGARPEQAAAQEAVGALLPLLQGAMRSAELALLRRAPERLLDGVEAQLEASGRVLLPVSVKDERQHLGTDTSGEPNIRGGHALLVCVSREADGSYAAQVFNTGAGIRAHAAVGGRRFHESFEVRRLPADEGLKRRYLGEMLQLHGHGLDLKGGIALLYERLAGWGSTVPAQGRDRKPQTMGNCTWKCLMAFLKANLDEVSYRSFKVFLRGRILYEAIYDATPVDRAVTLAGVVGRVPGGTSRRLWSRRRAAAPQPAPSTSRSALVGEANARLARDVGRLYGVLRAQGVGGAAPQQLARASQALLLAEDAGIAETTRLGQPVAGFDVVRFVEAEKQRSAQHADLLLARHLAAEAPAGASRDV